MHCFYCEAETKILPTRKFPVFDIKHQSYFEVELGNCMRCMRLIGINRVKIVHLEPNERVVSVNGLDMRPGKVAGQVAHAALSDKGKLRDLE